MLRKLTSFLGLTLIIGLTASAPAQVPFRDSSKTTDRSASKVATANFAAQIPVFAPLMEISLSRAITQEVRASSGHERGNLAIAAEPADVHLEINLEQREVSVYRGDVKIKSYPIGIGRAGWETPIGTFEVNQMRENPTWISPFTGERIPGGDPRNPLGNYWIGFWTDGYYSVGFHGTPDSGTIGNAESHGCIHMYDQDLEELYQQVNIGTPVTVIQ